MNKEKIRIANLAQTENFNYLLPLITTLFPPEYFIGSIYTSNKISAFLKTLEKSSTDFFFGSYINHELCGFIHLKLLKNSVHLNHIATMDNFKGRGVGNALIDFAKSFSKSKNKALSLHVDSRNSMARSWYEKIGFATKCKNTVSLLKNPFEEIAPCLELMTIHSRNSLDNFGFTYCDIKLDKNTYCSLGLIEPNFIVFGNEQYALTREDILELEQFIDVSGFSLVIKGKLDYRSCYTVDVWESISMELKV